MKREISFRGILKKFPGEGGWTYVVVPKRHIKDLKEQRKAWGKYPITAHIGKTYWETKLMIKKGGDFFVAIKSKIRVKEKINVGDKVSISFRLK